MPLFLSEKNQNPLNIPAQCIRKLGKIQSDETFIWRLLLIFELYTGTLDTVTSLYMGFHREWEVAGLG